MGGLTLLLAALALAPIRLYASVGDDLSLKIKFLGLEFDLLPAKESPMQADATGAEKKGKVKKLIGEKGVFATVSELVEIAKMLLHKAVWVLKKLKIHRLEGTVSVAEGDAAETGIKYGATCSVVYPAIGFLGSQTDISNVNVSVAADFDSEESAVMLDAEISLKALFAVCAAVSALWQYIKIKAVNNSNVNTKERKK